MSRRGHLFDLRGIRLDCDRGVAQVQQEVDVLADQSPEQSAEVVQQGHQVDRLLLHRLTATEGQQLAGLNWLWICQLYGVVLPPTLMKERIAPAFSSFPGQAGIHARALHRGET